MNWISRKKSMTISAELHRSIERTCTPIMEDPGEVVAVRPAGSDSECRMLTGRRCSSNLPSPRRLDGSKPVKFAAGF